MGKWAYMLALAFIIALNTSNVVDGRAMEFLLQPTKLTGVECIKRFLISDMKMQSLEFVQLIFSLALVQLFPHGPTLPFKNDGIYPVLLHVGNM